MTSIGKNAFYSCDLKRIKIHSGITTIGTEAFDRCELNYVEVPSIETWLSFVGKCGDVWGDDNHVYVNGEEIFELIIPDGITTIPDHAFKNCGSLDSVTIPDTVTSIGDYSFSNCDGLVNVDLPESIKSIGGYAFSDCDGLTSIKLPESINSIPEGLLSECDGLKNIEIPDNVKSIGKYAFSSCRKLENVLIGEKVQSIGYSAFSYCDSIYSIRIPSCVTSMGTDAFSSRSVNRIDAPSVEAWFSFIKLCPDIWGYSDNHFCIKGEEVSELSIPFCAADIPKNAFYKCKNLTSVIIAEGVESIADFAFYYCKNLTCVTIPESLKDIGGYAFSGCSNLKFFIVPDVNEFAKNHPGYRDMCFTASEKEEADQVIQLINSLPETTTYDDRADIENVRAAYEALSKRSKTIVPGTVLKKLIDAESFLDHTHNSYNKTYKYSDKVYHIACFTCNVCGEYFEVKEKHQDRRFAYQGYEKVDDNYHAVKYTCDKCHGGAIDIDHKEGHHYWEDGCIEKATITTEGVMGYRCTCGETKTGTFSWSLGDDNSVSYDPWNAKIYNNAKKITVYLTNPLKGSVLKVKIGKKTYTKKINNYKKKFKIKIKKAKYGSKINIQLLYNGRVVGRSEDYVYYAKKLRRGMTIAQAGWTWDPPYSIEKQSGGWTFWCYPSGSYIGFKGGRVRTWRFVRG